jgi:hypothetical protein
VKQNTYKGKKKKEKEMKEMKKLPCYCQETRHSAPDPCKCISYHIQYATQYMQEKNNGVVVQLYD